ncbi:MULTISPECIES: hypothetical protein [Kitasatospora]|uniref:Uncharacterized protein n=1 Tax=Kitasatospora cystarginea TaxID=58350 RepID=A0ABN3ETG3_9ACTN
MIEYQLIQHRGAELRREAEHVRLVRQARTARTAARTARQHRGVLARLARGVRRPVARRYSAQPVEC